MAKQQKQLNVLRFLEGSIVGNEKEAWDKIENKFLELMVDGKLFKDKFGACIRMDHKHSKDFDGELFDVLCKRKNIEAAQGITLRQLNEFYEELISTDLDSRLEIFFDLCDKNDDDKISVEEVKTVLKWTASANKLTNILEQIDSHASLIVKGLDPDGNGFIEFEHMKIFIKELWDPKVEDKQQRTHCPRKDIEMMNEKWKRILVITLWSAINLGLFVWKFMEYMDKEAFEVMGYCLCFAKGSAETLKFNMGLILFLACRGTLTKLRASFLSSIFPFDDHIYYHMLVGGAILAATFLHMIMHLGCGFPKLTSCPTNKLGEIIGPSFEFKQPTYSDFVISVPGVTGILMVIIMLFCFTLAILARMMSEKNEFFIGFNAFWYAHHLLFLVYVLLILHGYFISLAWDWLKRTTWMYIVLPILFYANERRRWYKVNVKKAEVYGGKDLLALNLEKPKGFKNKSGMYLLINCPVVSKFEWHPFSITSAPGDDYLSVHIRSRGDWTKEIINIFDKDDNSQMQVRREGEDEKKIKKELESSMEYAQIFVRGPYGAPAQNYKDFDILLLIGLGVGATPMISVLKDLLNHIKTNAIAPPTERDQAHQTSVNNSVKQVTSRLSSDDPKVPKKAYFYWVTKTQASFECFAWLMNDIADYDSGKVIEMHNHFSPLPKEGDARSLFFTILQKRLSEKDIISRSRIRTRFGRPEWEDVFSNLESTHIGCKIGVFFCGDSSGNDFRSLCEKHSHGSTRFHFHKENF